jgi:hypothetical protein
LKVNLSKYPNHKKLVSVMVKSIIVWTCSIIFLLVIGIGIFYQYYFTGVVTEIITSPENEILTIIPEKIRGRINKANSRATEVYQIIKETNVPLPELFDALDEVKEEDVYVLLDSLNKIENVEFMNNDILFDIGKKYIPTRIDVEVFRKVFKEKMTPNRIRRVLNFANEQRTQNLISSKKAKKIIKQILKEKEQEFSQKFE